MIILIRHAQSEGNKNRDIHQYVPDHRVRLTPDGQLQAEDAGRRLRDLLKPDDTIQFFTSPYRRTRETTEGILRTLTSNDEQLGPSPFPRDKIKVYEEPRLREQDFGNFQPCSAEMERMWQERADYGHFFYRIPNGESAADAYDRVSGFNESLWRQFGESDFPSVCVLVTHGLMTRVFLMKWYHWSVEYFEDLRNINHCEFIIMKQNYDNGKYILQNELRTWSDLKRRAAVTNNVSSISLKAADPKTRMWGGCAMGCNHAHMDYPKRPRRQNTLDFIGGKAAVNEKEDHPVTSQDADLKKKGVVRVKTNLSSKAEADVSPTSVSKHHHQHENHHQHVEEDSDADPSKGTPDGSDADDADADSSSPIASPKKSYSGLQLPLRHKGGRQTSLLTKLGRDGGGSKSGLGSPNDISDEADDSDWFDTNVHQLAKRMSISQTSRSEITRSALSQINETMSSSPPKNGGSNVSPLRSRRSGSLTRSGSHGGGTKRSGSASATKRRNTKSEQEMIEESGMNGGRRADALGDVDEDEVDANDDVEEAKIKDRKSLSEVY
jgi:broad specificity phosphatase PhoE